MSFGSPTPVEVVVNGTNLDDDRAYAAKVRDEMAKHHRPSAICNTARRWTTRRCGWTLDRERLGQSGVTVQDVARPLLAATSSSRLVVPNYWARPDERHRLSGAGAGPAAEMDSAADVGTDADQADAPTARCCSATWPRCRKARCPASTTAQPAAAGQPDGQHRGRATSAAWRAELNQALRRAGDPPRGVQVEVRGQVEPMRQMFSGLGLGLGLAVVAIFLLLTAYFQSPRLALTAVGGRAGGAVPAWRCCCWRRSTTLNIQSFMGAIMAIGVAVANAILLVTFAERHRAADGATARSRRPWKARGTGCGRS